VIPFEDGIMTFPVTSCPAII
jgi:hypothetical protein